MFSLSFCSNLIILFGQKKCRKRPICLCFLRLTIINTKGEYGKAGLFDHFHNGSMWID